jgi:hypothetical protein
MPSVSTSMRTKVEHWLALVKPSSPVTTGSSRPEAALPIGAAFDGEEEVRDGAGVPQRHAHDLVRIDDDREGRGPGAPQTRAGKSAKRRRPATTSSSSASSSSRR